jgi:hypothetical protein
MLNVDIIHQIYPQNSYVVSGSTSSLMLFSSFGGKLIISGTPTELKASIGGEAATLEQVFTHYIEAPTDAEGIYSEISRTRSTARRVG